MAYSILTPVTLWKDFDDSLPLDEETLSERTENGVTTREVRFGGRKTAKGRVKIYAQYSFPSDAESFPAVMILFEAPQAFDKKFIAHFLSQGYGVLAVDYCGDNGGRPCTQYPADVDYANYMRAGRHIDYAEPTARETSWYEWAGVARYAARYLKERKEVTASGAIGLRTGGEILFKIAPYAPLDCMISVCAAGWLAYRGIEKFSDEKQQFDEERYRFIAGIESQSYAPYVKCPVLLLSAVNDKKYNFDRVYDTFRMLNPEVEKAILFSAHGNGLIGSHSVNNLDLFLEKYLKGRSVFISKPVTLTTETDEEGNLIVRSLYDAAGELKECGIFFTEKVQDSRARDWTRVLGEPSEDENSFTVPLSLYRDCPRALVYAFAKYSNDFSVTSKIQEITIEKPYKNSSPKNRVIYNNADGYNGFNCFRRRTKSVADCFLDDSSADLTLKAGYGGIIGITAPTGIISFRVGEPRYLALENESICFDAYCTEDTRMCVTFYLDSMEENGYSADVNIEGGGRWKNFVLDPLDFKSPTGASLTDFTGVISVVFFSEKEVLINNVLWI